MVETKRGVRRAGLLPPSALLLSLVAQVPLVVGGYPLRPSTLELVTGLGFLCAGIVLNLWSERLFRKSSVGVCPFSAVPQLVRQGPYRLTRNPMYLGLVLVSASVPLLTGSGLNMGAPGALALWLHHRFVKPEETFLEEQLGQEYRLYEQNTPRWILF
jgi:protein-S-isoprenylcysteine O-methyltransferase Ste14